MVMRIYGRKKMNTNHFTETLLPMHIKLQGLYKRVCWEAIEIGPYIEGYCLLSRQRQLYTQCRDHCPKLSSGCEYWVALPRTIDDSSEDAQRRSLMGMLKGSFQFHNCIKAAEFKLYINKWHKEAYKGATPTEAILRALCAQEGIE